MLQIKSFFKPYRVELMAVLALIFVQAITSLLLPYFLSDIVNIGIQQQGIESEDFAKILLDYQSRGIDPAGSPHPSRPSAFEWIAGHQSV